MQVGPFLKILKNKGGGQIFNNELFGGHFLKTNLFAKTIDTYLILYSQLTNNKFEIVVNISTVQHMCITINYCLIFTVFFSS